MVCDKNILLAPGNRKWYYFILTSIAVYFGGLVIILFCRLIWFISRRGNRVNHNAMEHLRLVEKNNEIPGEEDRAWYLELKEGAGALISAQTLQGRILVVCSFIFSLAACALYVTESAYPVEHCLDPDNELIWKFEAVLNAFFFVHFAIRFFAANDKLSFWCMDAMSYVDFLTIPPSIVSLVLQSNWLGLRFLRAIHLIKLADILQFLNVLHTGSSVEMARIFGNFFALWLTSGGVVHLLENTGDFWHPITYSNNNGINYFESLYFLLVTMSTVGFGDIYCRTYLGRIFAMIFICVGLGLFASYIPAIIEFGASHTKYNRSFKPTPGRKHVIVAGHITEDSVDSFVRDFLHPDRENVNATIVFLNPVFPSITLQAILKRNAVRTSYFIGNVFDFNDCARVKMRDADAVIILCNKNCEDPIVEDNNNVLRVISVKNYNEHIRCIVQLMHYKNKARLLNCPQWNPKKGDDIVCINELKLGFIAQSCHAQGFSTFLANMFAMRADTMTEEILEHEQWKVAYMTGSANEMYTAQLSSSFNNMTFQQAAELCFEKLNLMMIAIEVKPAKGEKIFAINPNDKQLKIEPVTRGFFFTQNASDVERASKYCKICHSNLSDPEQMKKCRCTKVHFQEEIMKIFKKKNYEQAIDINPIDLLEVPTSPRRPTRPLTEDVYPSGDKPKFDATGTYYWCEARPFPAAVMSREELQNADLEKHVVVLLLAHPNSTAIGLFNLLLPLRASNYQTKELKRVILVGEESVILQEWDDICHFPFVDILLGSPYSRADLRATKINHADMCVLLSPGHSIDSDTKALADKHAIMATQNLKAMKFDDDTPNLGDALMKLANPTAVNPFAVVGLHKKKGRQGSNIRMITELVCDSNAMYLDQDDMNIYDDDGIYLTQAYACGSAFTVSVLDSLVSATYFNSDILTLVRHIVTGTTSSELENELAEGVQSYGSYETGEIAAVRHRCKIAQISLLEGPLSDFGECGIFGDLYLYALRTYNMICLGLYRYRDNKVSSTVPSTKRYVITFPSFNMVLAPTDLVFVLMQFDHANKRKSKK